MITIWLTLFGLLPFVLITVASFLSHDSRHLITLPFTFNNYLEILNPIYFKIFEKSFYLAGACTLLCLLLGYPFAYILARTREPYKSLLMLLTIVPFWTSSLIRSYAIMALIKAKGILNGILMALGIIDHPLQLLFSNTAVLLALVYNLLPFMILPLFSSIERLDNRLIEAARDLGANKTTTFLKVIIPLSLPGILAGSILVFLPAMTLFYIPDLLGGSKSMLLGNLIQNQFLLTVNWPLGSATSILLTVMMLILLGIYWHFSKAKDRQSLL
ncbi:MAG: ABC transporter permease subunit [Proteobacteria bacterium]|nr:ABC transporter permease subunit [Pseudomonadota bacterium]